MDRPTYEQLAYAYQVGFEDGSRMPEGESNDAQEITEAAMERGEAWVAHVRDGAGFDRLL